MGEVRVDVVVSNPRTGVQSQGVTALADTGATLSVIPAEILHQLGISTLRRISLVLADGRRADRDVGEAAVAVREWRIGSLSRGLRSSWGCHPVRPDRARAARLGRGSCPAPSRSDGFSLVLIGAGGVVAQT